VIIPMMTAMIRLLPSPTHGGGGCGREEGDRGCGVGGDGWFPMFMFLMPSMTYELDDYLSYLTTMFSFLSAPVEQWDGMG
jgi:hypothetical protein